jgi:sporulation protein YlmC with PRC-barrel domain
MRPLPCFAPARLRLAVMLWLLLAAGLPFTANGQTARPDPAPPAAQAERVFGLMGKRILAPDGTEIGRVVDLVVDRQGETRAAVVDVGGFLGIGSRRIALAWGRMSFRSEDGALRIETDVAADRISAAPEFKPGEAASIFDPDEAR